MEDSYDYSEINSEVDYLLQDVERRIKECLKASQKELRKATINTLEYSKEKAESLGYKTSLECIKRTREKFDIIKLEKPNKALQKEIDNGISL